MSLLPADAVKTWSRMCRDADQRSQRLLRNLRADDRAAGADSTWLCGG
jgi:hypothetical protein